MQYKKINNQIIFKLNKGEKIIESLNNLIAQEKILGAFFYGIGALSNVEIAHYNVTTQRYSTKIFENAMELTNLTGTIGTFENKPLIHAHATLADEAMNSYGGHLVEGTISGTLEVIIYNLDIELKKQVDTETGLKIFDLNS